jgi:hypothetical protein
LRKSRRIDEVRQGGKQFQGVSGKGKYNFIPVRILDPPYLLFPSTGLLFRNRGSATVALIIYHPDFPWVDQERLVKTNVALAIGGLRAAVSEVSTSGMLDT